MVSKTELHRLVDELPEDDLEKAARYLKGLRDPMTRFLEDAPGDDELLTAEEAEAVDESYKAYRRGEAISAEQAKRELLG